MAGGGGAPTQSGQQAGPQAQMGGLGPAQGPQQAAPQQAMQPQAMQPQAQQRMSPQVAQQQFAQQRMMQQMQQQQMPQQYRAQLPQQFMQQVPQQQGIQQLLASMLRQYQPQQQQQYRAPAPQYGMQAQGSPLAYRPDMAQAQQALSRVKPSVYKTDLDTARERIAELEAAESARATQEQSSYYGGGG